MIKQREIIIRRDYIQVWTDDRMKIDLSLDGEILNISGSNYVPGNFLIMLQDKIKDGTLTKKGSAYFDYVHPFWKEEDSLRYNWEPRYRLEKHIITIEEDSEIEQEDSDEQEEFDEQDEYYNH